jgi:hypothetical protein
MIWFYNAASGLLDCWSPSGTIYILGGETHATTVPLRIPSRPPMLLLLILSVALVVLRSAVALCDCVTPQVRREWRSFSTDEKAAWLNAVKVRIDTSHTSLTLAIMLKQYSGCSAWQTSPMIQLCPHR